MNNTSIAKAFINKFQSSQLLLENCGRLLCLLLFALIFTIPVFSQSEAFRVKSPNNASLFYVQSDGSVAVDTSAALGSLTVNGNNGIIATGKFGSGTALNLGDGIRMMWYPKKAAFRAGMAVGNRWDDANIGFYSFATGLQTQASGEGSTAMGLENTTASGVGSTAMGDGTTASGNYSTAMGQNTTASGDYSTAMGNSVSTNGYEGSFIIGDSNPEVTNSTAQDEMMMRFSGGYILYSGALLNVGVSLVGGGNSWSTISDSTKKYAFLPVNEESVLNKIDKFDLRTWSYKGQDSTKFRHYGPMAQEFFAAFGHDKYGVAGNDTTINQADFEGINLIAIQALEKRTDELNKAINKLKIKQNELDALKANYTDLKNEFEKSNIKWQKVENMLTKLSNTNLTAG